MDVNLRDALEIGKGDIILSRYLYDKREGCDIIPHDSRDDSDRADPFLCALYSELNMLPGRLLFVRSASKPAKTQMKCVLKGLWHIDTASYHSESGFEHVCDERGNPMTLAMYSSDETMSLLFLYLPRAVKNHDIHAYTDEDLRERLEEVLDAQIY